MVEYLSYNRVNRKWTWICKMSGSPCPVVPKVTPKELGEMGWEGCACSCDRPMDKAMEERAERDSWKDVPDIW